MLRISLLMIVVGSSAVLAETKPENVAATVNGEIVRLDEVDAALKRSVPLDAPLTAAQTKRLRAEILDELVDERLLAQFLARSGPKIPPADIERAMQALSASLRKRKQTLADHLRDVGLTEQQVREQWTRVLQLQRLIEARATEAELRKYYADNKDAFENATVRASHIVIRLGPNATPGERAAAADTLAKLRTAIAKGEIDFATAAKKHSVCPSAKTGGDLGPIARKDSHVDEAFATAAFALKVGEVSEPVETDLGLHLIRVTERRAGTPTTFEKSIEHVRDLYAEDLRRTLLEKLRKDAKIQRSLP
jgi:parvulin-like peptidyl-prolyl isomerase